MVPKVAAEPYRCTVVLGLAVMSEWYRAGFETLVDDDRWQALTKPHSFVNDWADQNHAVWQEHDTRADGFVPAALH